MSPELSLVVPTYNRLEYLKRCLESIQESIDFNEYEIIVVDGGSTDGTRGFLSGQKNIRIVEDELKGPVRAFNKGFKAASGEYVCWINDDMVVLDNAIEKVLRFAQMEEANGLGAAAFYLDEGGIDCYVVRYILGLLHADCGMMKTSLMKELNYWDESFIRGYGDPDLSLRVWEKGLAVAGLKEARVKHCLLDDELRKNFMNSKDRSIFLNMWSLNRIKNLISSVSEDLTNRYLDSWGKFHYYFIRDLIFQNKGLGKNSDYLFKNAHESFNEILADGNVNDNEIKFYGKMLLNNGYIFYELGLDDITEQLSDFILSSNFASDNEVKGRALFQRGEVYFKKEKYDRAVRMFKDALAVCSNKPLEVSLHYKLGSNYEKIGRYFEAIGEFDEIVKSNISWDFEFEKEQYLGGAYFHLGCIHQSLGELEKTKHYLKECLKFLPGHNKAKEYLKVLG